MKVFHDSISFWRTSAQSKILNSKRHLCKIACLIHLRISISIFVPYMNIQRYSLLLNIEIFKMPESCFILYSAWSFLKSSEIKNCGIWVWTSFPRLELLLHGKCFLISEICSFAFFIGISASKVVNLSSMHRYTIPKGSKLRNTICKARIENSENKVYMSITSACIFYLEWFCRYFLLRWRFIFIRLSCQVDAWRNV